MSTVSYEQQLMVDTAEAAALLGVSKMTLVRLRTQRNKQGPPFKRVGGQVRYSTRALVAWASTSDGGEIEMEPPSCQSTGKAKRNSS